MQPIRQYILYNSIDSMSSETEYYNLTVETGDKATENFILDSQFHRIASGVGERCTFQLPKGIYSVKVRAGSITDEKPIVLTEDKTVSFELLKFFSPAPLEDTNSTTIFQADQAINYSKRDIADVKLGTGSKLFLFGTIYDNINATSVDRTKDPAIGLTLRDNSDSVLVDFGDPSIGFFTYDGEPWGACDVDISPGIYTLCLETAAKINYKLTIVACPSWQTQIFLQPRNYGREQNDIRTDLASSSIFMCKVGEGFVASSKAASLESPDLRLTELIRLGLINSRNIISNEVYSSLFTTALKDPMLGIYAAHMLILYSEYKSDELKLLVERLRALVGNSHPDVEAVALRLDMPTDFTFNNFPMLSSSWGFILEASLKNVKLIPKESLAYQNAGQFWNNDLWLIWGAPKSEIKKLPVTEITRMLIQEIKNTGSSKSFLEKILSALLSKIPFVADKYNLEKVANSKTIAEISKSLGIPRSKFIEVLKQTQYKEFSKKLELETSKSPIVTKDPQKDQWGGKPEVNGRRMSAIVESSTMPGFFKVTIIVESIDEKKPLEGEVNFYLHDTFFNPEPVENVIDGKAILKLHGVWGSFTAGAVADGGATKLELDLAELPGIPEEFKNS